LSSHAHDREAAASIDQGFPVRPKDGRAMRIKTASTHPATCAATRLPNLADLQDKANGRTWRRSATR
jgi:hypothetical protein